MSDTGVNHVIELQDGRKLELWYSVASAKRLRAKYGTFANAMNEELAETLSDLIFEGLRNREHITVDEIADNIAFSKASEYQEIVLAAMAGISVEDYKKRVQDSKLKEIARLQKKLAERGVTVPLEDGQTTDEYLMALYTAVAEKNEQASPTTMIQ